MTSEYRTRKRGTACTEGRKGLSGVIAATSKNREKMLCILGTKELQHMKVLCPADPEDTPVSGSIFRKFY